MVKLALKLVEPLAKAFLKSQLGETGASVGMTLLGIAQQRFATAAETKTVVEAARKAAREVLEALDEADLPDAALEAAAEELAATIDQHLSIRALLDGRLSADQVVAGLDRQRAVRFEPHSTEEQAYQRLLRAVVQAVLRKAPTLDGYTVQRDARLLVAQEAAAGGLAALSQAQQRHDADWTEFEHGYRRGLARDLDRVEIIGLNALDANVTQGTLSIAYLSLAVRLAQESGTARIGFETLLALLPLHGNRLVLEGAAGSGKTTLMRWCAIQAARSDGVRADQLFAALPELERWLPGYSHEIDSTRFENTARREARALVADQAWENRLPLLISLRLLKDRLRLEDAFLQHGTPLSPSPEWLQRQTDGGGRRLLLLLDGLDEVPYGQRRSELLSQIATLRDVLPAMQIVLTTRPGALGDHDLPDWKRVLVEELDEAERAAFVAHWHAALAARAGRAEDDAVIAALREAVLDEFGAAPSLARLATNPLLCAALCALHWMARKPIAEEAWRMAAGFGRFPPGQVLPRDIWALCEQLTHMLIHARDERRGLPQDALADIDYTGKRELLSRIAYAMTSGEMLSALQRDEAVEQVRLGIANFGRRPAAGAEAILDGLILRSGVLRGAGRDHVEFAHNTLKSFLAAKVHLGLNVPRDLVRRLLQAETEELTSGIDEIAVLASASPDHRSYAVALITTLLDTIERRRGVLGRLVHGRDPAAIRRLQVLVLRCEAVARDLPAELRGRVRALIAEVFPPRSVLEARQLAVLGNDAVPHLRFAAMPDAVAQAAAVRCLRLINTDQAWALAEEYLATGYLETAQELVAAGFQPLRVRAVRQAVTEPGAGSAFNESIEELEPFVAAEPHAESLFLARCTINDWEALRRLQRLRILVVVGSNFSDTGAMAPEALEQLNADYTPIRSLEPLAACQRLHTLTCGSTRISDLAPLGGLPALAVLDVSACRGVKSVEPLRGCTALRDLKLSSTGVDDLAGIAGLSGLTRLGIRQLKNVRLASLGRLPGLQRLDVTGVADPDLSVLQSLPALQELFVADTAADALGFLAGMPQLRMLDVSQTGVADLAPLRYTPDLWFLELDHSAVTDLSPLVGLVRLSRLSLSDTKVGSIDLLADLPALESLDLRRCRNVRRIDALAGASKLGSLDLAETGVSDLAPLRRLAQLRTLDITGTPVDDLKPLLGLPSLRGLYVDDAAERRHAAELKKLIAGGVSILRR
jgi:Leucine-rich repeat (LRR) protein